MSSKLQLKALLAVGAVSVASVFLGNGCVADRPSRNGVFNENQYIRKDFLVRPGDSTSPDSGWILNASITQASEPNVFGDASTYGLFAGASGTEENFLHFIVTSDKLQMASNRELTATPSSGMQSEVFNAWPITNVDLKYRVNLDGEKTNFYEENQELDWQLRQWVKVNFDKNDMSDLAPLGPFYNANIANCADVGQASTTLVPDSFIVDEAHDYMQWAVQVSLPILWTTDCMETYGPQGTEAQRLGRTAETVSLKYSLMRANANPTYQPLTIAEKDPIQKKYGPEMFYSLARDPNTGLLASNQYVERFDPTQEIKWYFDKDFPQQYMPYFTANPNELPQGVSPITGITTIEDSTNKLMTDAGAAARVSFHQFDEPLDDGTPIQREFGDVRFNIVRWIQSLDQQNSFAGVTSLVTDPRNGQTLSANIVLDNFAIDDYYAQRVDAYLQSLGASPGSPFAAQMWTAPTDASGAPLQCTSANIGQSVPIIPTTLVHNHDGNSTLFQKMQGYLYQPVSSAGPLGPEDFILQHNSDGGDFFHAYYTYIPYLVYGDPQLNPFVIPEGGDANRAGSGISTDVFWSMIHQEATLHQLESQLDHGANPYDYAAEKYQDARAFLDNYQGLTLNHRALGALKAELPMMTGLGRGHFHADDILDFSMENVASKDGRHCVNTCPANMPSCTPGSPHWETQQEWTANLVSSYWAQVFWHEFGHAMGLSHNFMGSVDRPNFPAPIGKNDDGSVRYPLNSNSVMEYNAEPDRIFWNMGGWAPYDQGAIAWIYANVNGNPQNMPQMPSGNMTASGPSGQITPTYPWLDPDGFCKAGDATCTAGQERQFLFCDERHQKYTPLCRPGDLGTTPSEIVANDIENYEWQYTWRNFRQYHKIWDDSAYGDTPMNFVGEARRFLSLWAFDMGSSELTSKLPNLGIVPPANAPSAQYYYDQLSEKFNDEMSAASSMYGAWHEAIIQQSSGQRPYATVFDNFFGDVTQQGIFLDKLDALQGFLALWPIDNYDPTQSAGLYIASYSNFGVSTEANGSAIGALYNTVEEDATLSMIGGSFQAFAYSKPLGVAQFALDTHSIEFQGANQSPTRQELQAWTGGWTFTRLDDFLAYFRQIAVANNFKVSVPAESINIDCTGTIDTCTYDPRNPQAFAGDTFYSDPLNQFIAPDNKRYIWIYLPDKNQWYVCDRDRNIATYQVMFTYNTDVLTNFDDGNGNPQAPVWADELQVKYFFDYYQQALSYSP